MTLTELTALETAYQVLEPLDQAARRRALQWLSDALGHQPVTAVPPVPDTPTTAAVPAAVSTSRARRGVRAASANAVTQTPPPAVAPAAKAATAKAKAVKTSRTAAAGRRPGSQAQAADGERAYRRMPDPAKVMKAYERIGTISGLAEHFDVPQHTVTHWARRLRGQGYRIGRTS